MVGEGWPTTQRGGSRRRSALKGTPDILVCVVHVVPRRRSSKTARTHASELPTDYQKCNRSFHDEATYNSLPFDGVLGVFVLMAVGAAVAFILELVEDPNPVPWEHVR